MIPLIEDIKQNKSGFCNLFCGLSFLFLCYEICSFIIAGIFNIGLKQYYCFNPAKILCIGHSMSEMGIDKTLLEKQLGIHVSKFCMNGVGPVERNVMLKQYLEYVKQAPQILVYDVNARLFSSGLAKNSYQMFLPFLLESTVCREFIDKYISTRKKLFLMLNPLRCYEETRLGAVQRGFSQDWSTRKNTFFNPEKFRKLVEEGNFWHISLEPEAIAAFEETIKICKEHKITLVLAALPNVDILNHAEPEKYQEFMNLLQKYISENKHIVFFDYNPEFSSKYIYFADPIHLRREGQKEITKSLAKDLLKVIKQIKEMN